MFAGIQTAAALINLDEHTGEHPRLGATDVVPFVPIRDVTMAECVEIARRLGQRVGEELNIPVYLYESAASHPDRENLANLRGESFQYEQLKEAIRHRSAADARFWPGSAGHGGGVGHRRAPAAGRL